MIINIFRLETEGLLSSLEDYLNALEAQIPVIRKKEIEKIENWAEYGQVEEGEVEAAIDEYKWNYEYYFPRSLRYSFIVLLFIVIEKQLTGYCDILYEQKKLCIKANKLRGDVIERTKNYTHSVAGIEAEIDWSKVEELSIIRNCIVHTLGEVEKSRDKSFIQGLAVANIGLALGNDEYGDPSRIQISKEYCSTGVKEIKLFFSKIFDAAGIGI